jgi:toxin secretion/phage lysis holin
MNPMINAWLVGHTLTLLRTLLILMLLDVVCGMIVAFLRKTLNSTISWRGMGKKSGTIMVIIAAALLQQVSAIPPVQVGQQQFQVLDAVVLFYVVNEALSVLEKAAILKVPMPTWFVEALERVRGDQAPPLRIEIQNKPEPPANP